jgi:hypothetical protein
MEGWMGKAKPRESGRGRRLVAYVTPETWAALVRLAAEETAKRGQHVSISALAAEWIQERVGRKGGR